MYLIFDFFKFHPTPFATDARSVWMVYMDQRVKFPACVVLDGVVMKMALVKT